MHFVSGRLLIFIFHRMALHSPLYAITMDEHEPSGLAYRHL